MLGLGLAVGSAALHIVRRRRGEAPVPGPLPDPVPDPIPDPIPDPVPGFGVLAGILNAPNVIILGDSIAASSFALNAATADAVGTIQPGIAAYAAAVGFTGNLVSYAQSGDTLGNANAKHALAQATFAATAGSNLFLTLTGVNDMRGSLPGTSKLVEFTALYANHVGTISAGGNAFIPCPMTLITKAADGVTVIVNPNDPATEANGTKPFSDAAILPLIQANWRAPGQRPFVDTYDFTLRNPHLLAADGLHGQGAALAHYVLASVAGRALGKIRTASRAGKAVIYHFTGAANSNNYLPGQINKFFALTTAGTRKGEAVGAISHGGGLDPFIEVRAHGGAHGAYTNGAGLGAAARVADARLHDAALLTNGMFVTGGNVVTFEIGNLNPGEAVTVTCVASTGVFQPGPADVTLTGGQLLQLDCRSTAASNQIVFAPVLVGSTGRLVLTVAQAAGTTRAAINAVLLDFA